VDDQPAVRRLVAKCLARPGFESFEAVDCAEATRMARERRIDLLIADVVMPGTTGPGLAASLKQSGLVNRFLFMSGHAPHTLAASGLEDSTALLEKPFTLLELIER
jgi:two-component system, cell cycle sensor histidine kinase and response regulator CckA